VVDFLSIYSYEESGVVDFLYISSSSICIVYWHSYNRTAYLIPINNIYSYEESGVVDFLSMSSSSICIVYRYSYEESGVVVAELKMRACYLNPKP
jgi:hypothetical protein